MKSSDILIETQRLIMRQFTLADVDAVYEFSTCEKTTQFTGDLGVVKTRQDALDIIENVWLREYAKYGYARYALVLKATQSVIGFCGVKFEKALGAPDIGYRLLPKYWGKGLGSEAVNALLEYASNILAIKFIVGEVVKDNIASSKILLNAGFTYVESYSKQGYDLERYEWHASHGR